MMSGRADDIDLDEVVDYLADPLSVLREIDHVEKIRFEHDCELVGHILRTALLKLP